MRSPTSRAILALAALALFALPLVATSCASPAGARTVTMEGEIIDPQCWYTHGGRGESHRDCALMCARGGQTLAFLNRAGERVYPIIAGAHGANPNDSLYAVVGYPVIVTGTLYARRGQQALVVSHAARIGATR